MATLSSILAWRNPWSLAVGYYHPWGHKESEATEHAHTYHPRMQHCFVLSALLDAGDARMSEAGACTGQQTSPSSGVRERQ